MTTDPHFGSWGRMPRPRSQRIEELATRHLDRLPDNASSSTLPYGLGRSYGDSCLNDGGQLLTTRRLDHLIDFDSSSGVLRCEAGTRLVDVLDAFVPRGWFPPVVPGTKYVTVGGAVANDIHGKNHHRAGSFGHHVRRIELLRSGGELRVCTPDADAGLFRATVGGLGLTGLILTVDLQLVRVPGPSIDVESVKFEGLDEFFELADASDGEFEHTVAWIDCMARRRKLGRGIFYRGNFSDAPASDRALRPRRRVRLPWAPPFSLARRWTVGPFNALYYHRQLSRLKRSRRHYDHFFFPLDGIRGWNRLYGPRGFVQFQCVIPPDERRPVRRLLETIADSGEGSFLAVLKRFGNRPPAGLLTFPRPGTTLALDFPWRDDATAGLLGKLEAVVLEAGGALYPAKDACMSAEAFRKGFPRLEEFRGHVDPAFSSSFWRRVQGDAA